MDVTTLAAAVALVRKNIDSIVEESIRDNIDSIVESCVESSETISEVKERQIGDESAIIQIAEDASAMIRDLQKLCENLGESVDDALDLVQPIQTRSMFLAIETEMSAEIRSLKEQVSVLQPQVSALAS